MQFWNTIINASLLGTSRKPVQLNELLQGELAPLADHIPTDADPEEKFLQAAALAYQYRQSGTLPLKVETLRFDTAPSEEKPYCSPVQQAILQEILANETIALLELWLKACWKTEVLVQLGHIPALLALAVQQSRLQKIISICCGKRGAWLAAFNPTWQFASTPESDDLWTTGTPDQRRKLLRLTLKQDGTTARQMLHSTWPQENAATRTEFLKILHDFVAPEDEAWLQTLLPDKSKNVKAEAWALLKKLPTSFITQKYKAVLHASVQTNSKGELSLQLPPMEGLYKDIYTSGIEKLSSARGVSDEDYILYQLMQHTPLQWLEESLQIEPEQIIGQFKKATQLKKFIPALADAVANFKDARWAQAFYTEVEELYIPLASLLPAGQQDKYLLTYLHRAPDAVLAAVSLRPKEWSYELALSLLKHTAQFPHRYNKGFYNGIIHLIPDSLAADINLLIPHDSYTRHTWYSLSDHLYRLLTLKRELKLAFPNL
jgi:hypothetical protein